MKNLEYEIEKGFARSLNIENDKLPSDLSPKDTSRALDISEGTLAVWRCTKRYNLPYYKIGSNVRYPLFGLVKFKLDRLQES